MKRLLFVCMALVVSAICATGYSDIDARNAKSKKIIALKTGECKGESAEILKTIEYGAVLVVHNETEELADRLTTAAGIAASENCRNALKNMAEEFK